MLFLSFLTNQKQKSGFEQVGGLVTGNISFFFCLWRVALYFKAMSNTTEFYKGIFLHVVSVRIIVSWKNIEHLYRYFKFKCYQYNEKDKASQNCCS